MSTLTTPISAAAVFLQEAEALAASAPEQQAALDGLRRQAMVDFNASGMPGPRHEEWRYLNLSPLQTTGYRTVAPDAPATLTAADVRHFNRCGDDAIFCVMENGRLNTTASRMESLPAGLQVGTYATLGRHPAVQAHLFRHAPTAGEPFVALNTMLSYDPVIVLADKNVRISKPLQLAFVATAAATPRLIPARVLVVAAEGSECTIMESYHTMDEGTGVFTTAVTETVIGENARVHYSRVQEEGRAAMQISYHRVHHAANSYQHLTTLILGGQLVRNNLYVRLDGENIDSYLNGLYVLDGTQVADNHTLVDHALPHCHSNELYKGIIDDEATGIFNGKIWVRPDAQKTNAYQSNKNLLLSDAASMNTKPQLEIYADDVKCSHGATTGQLDDDALFYLRARGIGETVARALLNHAFAADVLEQVEHETIRRELLALLENKLTAMAAK